MSDSIGSEVNKSIEINASPDRVWAIVSEVRNAPQWSVQARKVFATGGRTQNGTLSLNFNTQGRLAWATTSKVVEFEPGRRIANRVFENFTVWTFELEPTANGGTVLIERRETPDGISHFSRVLSKLFFGGTDKMTQSMSTGVSTSLQRIKEIAERE